MRLIKAGDCKFHLRTSSRRILLPGPVKFNEVWLAVTSAFRIPPRRNAMPELRFRIPSNQTRTVQGRLK
jgi:hypothetical protein